MRYAGRHILIVDDEQRLRDLFKCNLEEQGYICHTADTGAGALEVLTNQPVDLALIDVVMPGMTGLSLFQRIREHHPDVAVVFVTGVDDPHIAVEYVKNGADDYVVKPVTRKRLLQTTEDALARRSDELNETRNIRLMEERIGLQSTELDQRLRELKSLNRLFQAELSQRFGTGDQGSHPGAKAVTGRNLRRGFTFLQESLKKRIADYLNGHVQSKLLFLQHRLKLSQELLSRDPEAAAALLEDARGALRSIQEQDIRRASHELYPSIVKVGLTPALRSLTARLGHAVPIELRIEEEIQDDEEHGSRLFSEELTVGAYRIVEEALDNTVKHSNATMAWVSLSYLPDGNVSLDIGDDGRGFAAGEVSSALAARPRII